MNKSQLKAKETRKSEREQLKRMYGEYWIHYQTFKKPYEKENQERNKKFYDLLGIESKTGGWS